VRTFALIAAAIALFAGATLYLVNRLTEPEQGTRAVRALDDRLPPPAAEPLPPLPDRPAAPSFAGADPTQAIVIPAPPPPPTGPVPNATPSIEGPPPMPLPADPAERGAALDQVRRQRMSEQMERLNRRNLERTGQVAPPAPTPEVLPAPEPAPGPGSGQEPVPSSGGAEAR
jgi:hypothetical protein